MGFRIDVGVISWIQLPVLSGYLHRLTSRFFLNLRNIVYHQQQTSIGARSAIPTVAAPRAHATWKLLGRPTTDFIIDTSIDQTPNTKNDPNEGAIQQAELFHLEVVRTRNEHNGEMHDSGTKNDAEQW